MVEMTESDTSGSRSGAEPPPPLSGFVPDGPAAGGTSGAGECTRESERSPKPARIANYEDPDDESSDKPASDPDR